MPIDYLSPSGGDDTANINMAYERGIRLATGLFLISGPVNMPLGQAADPGGQSVSYQTPTTYIKATSSAAQILLGPALGNFPQQIHGRFGLFTFDANNIAGTNGAVIVNSEGSTLEPFRVINGLGDGIIYGGQNCFFQSVRSETHAGCCWAQDQGAGGALVLNYEFTNPGRYYWETRQTVTYAGQGYPVPENNTFVVGRMEADLSAMLAGVHQLAGWNNLFLHAEITVTHNNVPNVLVDSDATPHASGALVIGGNCSFNGPGTGHGTAAIKALGTSTLLAPAVILYGYHGSGGTDYFFDWANTTPVQDNCTLSINTGVYAKASGGTINRAVFQGSGTTGAGSAALGANCPASTVTAPNTWLRVAAPDGSTLYVPAWK